MRLLIYFRIEMGNNESVSAGNKAQADTSACDWYKLLALSGEGELPCIVLRILKGFGV